VLAGDASWDDVDAALADHADFLARWTAEQDVQTNEVQRAWALLPAFLSVVDERPLDLLELGPSGGLNLLWDRYRYAYSSGSWGDGSLTLTGDDRTPPPAELFEKRVTVARRRGVDLNQTKRLERLRRAIEVVRSDPPSLMQGDYVEALPSLLRGRREGTQLVVFQTASTMYLGRGALERVHAALHEAAREEPLVFVSTGSGDNGFSLDVARYPDGRVSRLGTIDFHGEWLEWGQ
jgi:hypothetical protein